MINEWILRDSRSDEKILHPTTIAALSAIDLLELQAPPRTILDLGCGSGILTLAAGEKWPDAQFIAADISDLAVQDTRETFNINKFKPRVKVIRSAGFANEVISVHAPYDILLSNLLAENHIQYAHNVKILLDDRGRAVLSGILPWFKDQVIEAYITQGFSVEHIVTYHQWNAIIIAKI